MSARSARKSTAAIISRCVDALAKRMPAPGARSWTISIIAVPSDPASSPPLLNARCTSGVGASPLAIAAASPATPSEITPTRTPAPLSPNRSRASSARSAASPSLVTVPAAMRAYVGGRSASTPSSRASSASAAIGTRYCARPRSARKTSTCTPSRVSAAESGPAPTIDASTCTAPRSSNRNAPVAMASASRLVPAARFVAPAAAGVLTLSRRAAPSASSSSGPISVPARSAGAPAARLFAVPAGAASGAPAPAPAGPSAITSSRSVNAARRARLRSSGDGDGIAARVRRGARRDAPPTPPSPPPSAGPDPCPGRRPALGTSA